MSDSTQRMSVNEYGTPVSVHTCSACGEEFTVCPATTSEKFGTGCLAEGCPSYDIARDVDLFWDVANELGMVRHERG